LKVTDELTCRFFYKAKLVNLTLSSFLNPVKQISNLLSRFSLMGFLAGGVFSM
jgi:hypothetical protein